MITNKRLTVKAVIFGSLCSMLIAVVLMCVLSAVILTSGLLPSQLTSIITIVLLSLGTFAGGFIAARITKQAGLITGLLTGICVFFVVTAISLTVSNDSVTYFTLIKLAATVAASGLGGIIGVNRKEKLHIK